MAEMTRSWLVQRLDKPHGRTLLGLKDNPFSFGGGLVNGGLSGEVMDLLRGIFSFDYMGAAEFEWGAVPKALGALAERAEKLTAWTFTIPVAKVAPHWKERDKPAPEGDATLYVIAPAEWRKEIEKRIRGWAAKPYEGLKEGTRLDGVLRPPADDPYPTRTAGWLELDNGWFFFADEDMWRATAELFGVTIDKAEARVA